MKINRIHAVLGFLLLIMPLLGFGHVFNYAFSMLCGATILYFAMRSIHIEYRKKHKRYTKHDTFVEGRPRRQEKVEEVVITPEVEKVQEVDSQDNL